MRGDSMVEAAAFLEAIRADPADDTTRLVFADWLDERDDPLGEFIRLQMELEPLRRPCPEPAAELERVKRLRRIPPGKDRPWNDWPLGKQVFREEQLLRKYKKRWLGKATRLDADYQNYFEPEFRRGFVASAGIGLKALLAHGDVVRRECPALQRLIVFGTLGRAANLAACAALTGLPELTLAGWLNKADALALAKSPHLADLRSLTFWLGTSEDSAVCQALYRLPGLRELTLVQMLGGGEVSNPVEHTRRAERLAQQVRKKHPEWQVRVERPFERRFPLDGVHIGRGIYGGHLPSGQAVLVDERKQPILMYFDENGYFVREEQLDFRDKLVKPPPYSWEDCDGEELIELLIREIGFNPGPIFVREFYSELADVGVTCWGIHQEAVANPESTDPDEAEDVCRSLHWWWTTSQFLLPFGNYYWADALGRVHSS
jgi:uncharacterized protein (TIGR02996 family)